MGAEGGYLPLFTLFPSIVVTNKKVNKVITFKKTIFTKPISSDLKVIFPALF